MEKGVQKKYEIALSYAHKDEAVAEIIKKEIESIFADGAFMDNLCPEELATAEKFEKQLQDIFLSSNYAIILNSDHYRNGKYTLVEMEAILQQKKSHLFILNINDSKVPKSLSCRTYTLLKVEFIADDWMIDKEVYRQIREIIHNKVKKCMIKQSIKEKKMEDTYAFQVQTMFANGNDAHWNLKYDWNMIGKAFIEEHGRNIRKESSWQELWQYVADDFDLIKKNLEPDTMRRIFFNCHLSIAYKLGQLYGDLGQASGNRNLELCSSNRFADTVFRLEKNIVYDIGSFDFLEEYDGNDHKSKDIICIISIKPRSQTNILETVKYFLKGQGQKYRKICLFQQSRTIQDADTLENIAEYIRVKVSECSQNCGIYGKYTVHMFPDTTAPLMFVLGARTIVPGETKLYEFIQEKNGYQKSLDR